MQDSEEMTARFWGLKLWLQFVLSEEKSKLWFYFQVLKKIAKVTAAQKQPPETQATGKKHGSGRNKRLSIAKQHAEPFRDGSIRRM
jgi:hypothetical protein